MVKGRGHACQLGSYISNRKSLANPYCGYRLFQFRFRSCYSPLGIARVVGFFVVSCSLRVVRRETVFQWIFVYRKKVFQVLYTVCVHFYWSQVFFVTHRVRLWILLLKNCLEFEASERRSAFGSCSSQGVHYLDFSTYFGSLARVWLACII